MDILSYLMGKLSAGGGGSTPGEAVLIDKTINENGTYNASSDNADGFKKVVVAVPVPTLGTKIITQNGLYDASDDGYGGYSELDVDVPNTYSAGDEGKVVSNGALVSQSSQNITENGTYDTTLKNQVVVNVPSSGITIDEMASGEKPSGNIVIGTNIAANAFYGRTAITGVTISGSSVRKCGASAFYNCTGLTKVFGPIGGDSNAFKGCTELVYYISTANESISVNPNYGFYNCSKLQAVDLSHRMNVGFSSALGIETFRGCSVLNVLVLRENQIFGLGNTNCFRGTPFDSDGAGGDIYIPKSLYDALGTGTNDYKSSSNWSTIDGYGTITWHAIEGSYYETHYADGTVIS